MLKYYTVRKVLLNFNRKMIERDKIDTLAYKYTTVHFPSCAQTLQLKVVGFKGHNNRELYANRKKIDRQFEAKIHFFFYYSAKS